MDKQHCTPPWLLAKICSWDKNEKKFRNIAFFKSNGDNNHNRHPPILLLPTFTEHMLCARHIDGWGASKGFLLTAVLQDHLFFLNPKWHVTHWQNLLSLLWQLPSRLKGKDTLKLAAWGHRSSGESLLPRIPKVRKLSQLMVPLRLSNFFTP